MRGWGLEVVHLYFPPRPKSYSRALGEFAASPCCQFCIIPRDCFEADYRIDGSICPAQLRISASFAGGNSTLKDYWLSRGRQVRVRLPNQDQYPIVALPHELSVFFVQYLQIDSAAGQGGPAVA